MGTVLTLIVISVLAMFFTSKETLNALERAEAEEARREGRIC